MLKKLNSDDLQDLPEKTPKKRRPFCHRGLECKSQKSRNTWSNRQICLGAQKEAGQRLTESAKRAHWSQQTPSSSNTREDSSHVHHQTANTELRLIIFFAAKDESAKTRLGADSSSDHELLIAKFRLKLKNVGKTTRPFRHDLNQIPYDYTVEVTNRLKGLDLIVCVMNYGWRFVTLYLRQ